MRGNDSPHQKKGIIPDVDRVKNGKMATKEADARGVDIRTSLFLEVCETGLRFALQLDELN
ncbi:MAG: hypothetical protein MUQ00_12825 [Candidatus Aminicenantes bacterium]|nr:hypothetical protein [Candidatus Aminicenantes bacterium]